MARMSPANGPAPFDPDSHEDDIYYALKENLSNDYFVIHNFHILYHEGHKEKNTQCDFLLFHPQKGFMAIEAKYSRNISFNRLDNESPWRYGANKPMGKNRFDKKSNTKIYTGPFEQASNAAKETLTYLDSIPVFTNVSVRGKCKFVHAVWFHGIQKRDIQGTMENFDKEVLLDIDDLKPENTEKSINRIFNATQFGANNGTNLTPAEEKLIFNKFIEAKVDIETLYGDSHRLLEQDRLLREQSMALNFIQNQRSVTISGGAGTGKTVLAEMRAKELAGKNKNEYVLFLCYNAMLKDKIAEELKEYENILVHNVDSFVIAICGQFENYKRAAEIIGNQYGQEFTVQGKVIKHVLVDEAQDWGRKKIEESKLLENLQDVVIDGSEDSTFCAFFDKLQSVNDRKGKLPKLIENSLCRIPLETNCRNTIKINDVSLNPLIWREDIKNKKNPVRNGVDGKTPEMTFLANPNNLSSCLKAKIEKLKKENDLDATKIVILTMKTVEKSKIFSDCVQKKKNSYSSFDYFSNVLVTTCARYKGLENDAIILIDVDEKAFSNEANAESFYVGATRARLHLNIVSTITEEQAKEILTKDFKVPEKEIDEEEPTRKQLAKKLNTFWEEF